jgi:hypothetical protein
VQSLAGVSLEDAIMEMEFGTPYRPGVPPPPTSGLSVGLADMRLSTDMLVGHRRNHDCNAESVVGVERQSMYPRHHGSVQTPLLRPATIPEKRGGAGLCNCRRAE